MSGYDAVTGVASRAERRYWWIGAIFAGNGIVRSRTSFVGRLPCASSEHLAVVGRHGECSQSGGGDKSKLSTSRDGTLKRFCGTPGVTENVFSG